MELRSSAKDFLTLGRGRDALSAFLESVALVSDTDNLEDAADAVTLITLHQAKGLEFRAVFMVGMEEGMLPHIRSLEDEAEDGGGAPAGLRRRHEGQGAPVPAAGLPGGASGGCPAPACPRGS